MTQRFVLLLILLLCCFSRGYAAELRLEECLELALQNNNGLKATQEDLVAALEETVISRAGLLPALELEGGYSLLDQSERLIIDGDSFAAGIPPEDVEVPVDNENFYKVDLSLKQSLFTGGRLTHIHRRARRLEEKNRQQLKRREREILRDVELAFHEALNARLYTEMVGKAVEAKQERLRILKELKREGYVGKEDLLQQETDLLFTELKLVKGANREQLARRRLVHLMAYEGDPEQLVLSATSFNAVLTMPLDDALTAAEQYREDLGAAATQIDIMGEEVTIARSGYYPQVSLAGKYTRQKETNLTREDVWSVAAQLEWPLFEWGRTRAEVRQKKAQKRQAAYQRRELENAVRLEAEQAWRTVKEGEKAILAHHKQLLASEYGWGLTAERYAAGKVKLADLIDSEAELLKAYHEYLMAINDLHAGLACLEAAVSRSLAPWLLPADMYAPSIDFAAQRARSPLLAEQAVVRSSVIGKNEEALVGRKVEPSSVGLAKTSSAEPSSAFVVQVGSFKNQRNAEDLRKELAQKFSDRKVLMTTAGDFHRVRIVGYNSKQEAQQAMAQAGVRPYLVLKVDHER